ncbi:DUF3999 domain-containing protein [Pseudomonas sp. HR96]|nr:DUF3999 domain-containing protein [Pseudomonas sp. HR96]WPP02326.1 DUF3999 domain-containing protein [Pseudomonas sp. HR96]
MLSSAALAEGSAPRPADFARQWPLAAEGAGPWYHLDLPLSAQLLAHQADLGDLRVFDAAGQPQPYFIARPTAAHAYGEAQAGVKWFPLYDAAEASRRVPDVRVQLAGNGSVSDVQPNEELEAGEEILRGWLLDTSAIKAPLIHLNFDWTSEREGFQHFSIEASDDLKQWQPWGDGQVGRFSFADERIEQHDVDLAARPARYLRLLWKSPQAAPILTSVQVTSDISNAAAMPLTWSEPVAGRSDKPNEYIWQLPAALAVERIKVLVEQSNSLAPVAVYGRSEAGGSWQPLQNGLLYRLAQNGQDFVQDQLALPGQTLRQIMLQVDDRGGGLGSAVPRLEVATHAVQVLFKGEGKPPFTLALGNSTVRGAPVAPVDVGAAGQAHVVVAAPLKPAAPLPAAAAVAPAPASAAPAAGLPGWAHAALWAGLVVAALLLVAMAWSLGRARSARPR